MREGMPIKLKDSLKSTTQLNSAKRAGEHLNRMSEMAGRMQKAQTELAAAPIRQQEQHHKALMKKHEELIAMERELLREAKKDKWKVALITGIISAFIGAIVGALM